jgi:uncharacterized protein YdhG (YjbR/CyaY superfamily)
MATMDEYLAGLAPDEREALQKLRATVLAVVPGAEEGTSYGVPAYRHRGRPLLGFQATTQHLSVMPFSPAAIESVAARLDGFDRTKGSIRFSAGAPLPDDVVADLVRARLREIEG